MYISSSKIANCDSSKSCLFLGVCLGVSGRVFVSGFWWVFLFSCFLLVFLVSVYSGTQDK